MLKMEDYVSRKSVFCEFSLTENMKNSKKIPGVSNVGALFRWVLRGRQIEGRHSYKSDG